MIITQKEIDEISIQIRNAKRKIEIIIENGFL
jgi:hypothetical protein